MKSFNRSSGVLLPISAFPDDHDAIGTLGRGGRKIAYWLKTAGQKYLQVLPLGPAGFSNSPFDGPSLLAGNYYFIDLETLVLQGDLAPAQLKKYQGFVKKMPGLKNRADFEFLHRYKLPFLKATAKNFIKNGSAARKKAFQKFCAANRGWLNPYGYFMALKDLNNGCSWNQRGKDRQPLKNYSSYPAAVQRLADLYLYLQWQFEIQWQAFRKYLHGRGLRIIGDLPVYAAYDSADVWANQDLFQLDQKGRPTVVAGVPPDYFSATGQRWGNPIPAWHKINLKVLTARTQPGEKRKKEKSFYLKFPASPAAPKVLKMMLKRYGRVLSLVDIAKIDHFRGLAGYGVIPAGDKTAVNCCWVKGGGRELLAALKRKYGSRPPLLAEDLGVITPDVEKLRRDFKIPGMAIFQFAPWDSPKLKKDKYFPANYSSQTVAFTGTHDNDTLMGWFSKLKKPLQKKIMAYLQKNSQQKTIPWAVMEILLKSKAGLVIFPVQDILGLDSGARMNTPGSSSVHNWSWRLNEKYLTAARAHTMLKLTKKSGRI